MSHDYELLPTDTASPIRRRAPTTTSKLLSVLKLRHFRPVQLFYTLPPLVLLLFALDYTRRGGSPASRSGPGLRYDPAGLAYLDEIDPRADHPILELIERGRRLAAELQDRRDRVTSLQDAVEDYKAAFGMMPPEGFEGWYDFASSHDSTTAPSLLPFAHTSVLPYLSLPPLLLESRAIQQQNQRGIFGMTFHPEEKEKIDQIGISNEDDVTGYMSPRWDYPLLLEPIVPLLPLAQQPDRPMQISTCVKDGSCRLSHGELMEMSRTKARAGELWDEEELDRLENGYLEKDELGWPMTCPSGSRANFSAADQGGVSFIHEFMEYMDFCKRPELVKQNGEMIMEEQHIMRSLAPILAVSRLMHGADMMGVPTRAVNDTHDFEPWADKNRSQVVWRGTITGIFHRERYDWRSSQRDRLAFLTGDTSDPEQIELLAEGDGRLERRKYTRGELVERWMNVGVVDHEKQELIPQDINNMCGVGPTGEACRLDGKETIPCDDDHACGEMKAEINFKGMMSNVDALPYKYRFDIDGYGWSSRFRKLLSSNSLIIKSTVYPEWWSAQAIPWYHFVPMKYDYTDMFDIVSFFDGAPDSGKHPSEGRISIRDGLAEEIAENGRQFAMERMRWVDMQSYMYLFLLEYRRAWSLDREAATYRG